MTMPHMMNCEHRGSGWCFTCIGKLEAENVALRTIVDRLKAENGRTEASEMTSTLAQHDLVGGARPAIDRPAGTIFAAMFAAYQRSSQTIKDIVKTMTQIMDDPSATPDDREAAVDTLLEALFPVERDGKLGIAACDLVAVESEDDRAVEQRRELVRARKREAAEAAEGSE